MPLIRDYPSALAGLIAGSSATWVFSQLRNRSVLVAPSTHRVLKRLARRTGKRAEDLLREALRDLYAKYSTQEDRLTDT